MQTLFYVPFFILGALAFIHPDLKARFTTPSRGCTLGAAVAFIAYLLNQRYGSGDAWMYETESVITMVMGLWMVNVVFSLGHRLLNFQSARVTYFVNASLFIYLVHHPLTLFFGAYITPHISSNLIGFLCGLIFVMGIALILYEIHLRIPLLKFLFSGKPPVKQRKPRRDQVVFRARVHSNHSTGKIAANRTRTRCQKRVAGSFFNTFSSSC